MLSALVAAMLVAAFVVMSAAPGSAQHSTAGVGGLIVDGKTAFPIAGATVTLFRAGTRAGSAQTESAGRFTIPAIAPGIYHQTVSARGSLLALSSNLTLTAGSTVMVDTTLVASASSATNLQTIGSVSTSSNASLASATTITQSIDLGDVVKTGQSSAVRNHSSRTGSITSPSTRRSRMSTGSWASVRHAFSAMPAHPHALFTTGRLVHVRFIVAW